MMFSIRWRLTLWYTLTLAAILLGFGALVYGLLTRALYQRIDDLLLAQLQLLEDNRQDARLLSDPHGRLAHFIDEFNEHANIYCVVYDARGTVYEKTTQLASESVPPMPSLTPGQRRSADLTLPLIGRQRILAVGLRLGDQDFTAVLMAGLQDVDRERALLLAVLGTAGPAALALAGGLGYLMARKALKPMERLNRLTHEITADRLDRRLPVANAADELGRLTQTINAMIARLERSFAEIRRFTADASHELRTPLAVIRAETEVALAKPLPEAECRQLLGSILEECERLTRLTDQLLALSREDVRGNGEARDLVDLADLLNAVAETMRPLAEAKRQQLQVALTDALHVRGDAGRLRQVFYNLLDNAIKYTPEGGTIQLSLARKGHAAVATVGDTGIGIAAEHLPHVFERFYRVDKARTRAEGGTGLGLSITRSIVAAHGGQVELHSAPELGTTCTVILPDGSDA